jgi:DNA-binding protein HU-beta
VNKAQLIDSLSAQLGSKKAATDAVDGVIDTITRAVAKGERVAITGFGVFEKVARPARIGRNPRTGATVKIKKTSVPKFKAGQSFKDVVSGARKLPRAAATAAGTATRAATGTTAKKAAPARKTTAKKAAPAKKTTAKKTTAKKSAPAKKTTATKKTTARKTAAKR